MKIEFMKCPLCKRKVYPWQFAVVNEEWGVPQHFDCVRVALLSTEAMLGSLNGSLSVNRKCSTSGKIGEKEQ